MGNYTFNVEFSPVSESVEVSFGQAGATFAEVQQLTSDFNSLESDVKSVVTGGDSSVVTIDGVQYPSISKVFKDRFTAIQAAIQGRLVYATKADMVAAGAPPNGELAEVWNDSTKANNGIYGYAAGAWARSKYDPLNSINPPNLLFDPYHIFLSKNQTIGGWLWFNSSTPTDFTDSSPNLPINTPVATKSAGNNFRKQYRFSDLRLNAGDQLTVSALVYFPSGTISMNLFFREGATVLGSVSNSSNTPVGARELTTTITVPPGDINHLLIEINASAGVSFEVGPIFAARGNLTPGTNEALPEPIDMLSMLKVSGLGDLLRETDIRKVDRSSIDQIIPASKNLFDPNAPDVATDEYVYATNGQLLSNTNYTASGYISVTPGETYTVSYVHNRAFYDGDKQFVSSEASGFAQPTFVIPDGCYYVRLSIHDSALPTFQFEKGSSATSYEPYGRTIDFSKVPNGVISTNMLAADSVTPDKVSFFLDSKNLFNPNDPEAILGSYINYATGTPLVNPSYNATGYIPVTPGETYTISYSHQRAFYNANRQYVSGTNSGNPATFVVPDGCYLARFSVGVTAWQYFQVEVGPTATSYEPYGPTLDPDLLPQSSQSVDVTQFLTLDGAPKINPYRPELLRQTHYRLMKRALPTPEDTQLVISLGGDSYTHNRARWSGPFTEYMVERFGDAGGGWCGFGFLQSGNVAPWTSGNQPNYLNGNVRSTLYPTKVYGNLVGTYFSGASPDLAFATLSTAGDYITQGIPASPVHNGCDLVFIGTADGQIRYKWDSNGWNTVNVRGELGATQVVGLNTGIPNGAGTLTIEWAAGTVKLCGVNLISSSPGVRVNKLAATGSSISSWATAPASQFEAGFASLGAHLFIYMDGTNSQGGNMSATAWGNHLDTLYDRVKAASPGVDILFMTPAENQRVNVVPMKSYAIEARKRALTRRFCFNDTQDAFGDADNPSEYGSSGAVPLYHTDLIHPDPSTGGRVLVAEALKCVLPD